MNLLLQKFYLLAGRHTEGACSLSIQEAQAGGLLEFKANLGYTGDLSQKNKTQSKTQNPKVLFVTF